MSEFKVKCTSVLQNMTQRAKLDESGKPVVNEKGHWVYEPCPRWSFTFATVSGSPKFHATLNVQTTDPDEAAKYELNGVYLLSVAPQT